MPVLANSRHELFAEGVASGKSATQAYIDAGFSPDTAEQGASRLLRNVKVASRIEELKARIAKRVEITQADIVSKLWSLAVKHETEPGAANASVARASYMDVAKLLGMVTDKATLSGPDGGPVETSVTVKFVDG